MRRTSSPPLHPSMSEDRHSFKQSESTSYSKGRSTMRNPRSTIFALVLALAILAAACGGTTETTTSTEAEGTSTSATDSGGADTPQAQGDTLRVAVSRFQFETLDPAEAGPATHGYWDPIYDYLFDADGPEVLPGLIEEWQSSDDGLTWTFTVRSGVRWHNGRELDADDIKFNFDLMETRLHDTATVLRDVLEEVVVTAPTEIQITLSEPVPLLLDWLSATSSYAIVPREYGEMTTEEWLANPIGTGPWRYVDHSVGDYIIFEALDEHWRKVPEFEKLEMRVVPEDSTRLAMISRGDVDLIEAPLSAIPEIENSDANLNVISVKQAVTAGVYLTGIYNEGAPAYDPERPWADRRVREALNLAVNREAIIENLLYGEAQPAVVASVLPWQLGWKDSWESYPYDPERARGLLEEAGYPDGFPVTVHAYPRPGIPDLPLVIEAVAADWSRIGIDVEIFPSDWAGIARPSVREGEADFLLGHSLGVFAPDLDLVLWREPNRWFETSDLVNGALDRLAAATTREEVAAAIGEVGDAVLEDFAWVPIAIVNQIYVANADTIGEAPIVAHAGGLNHLEFVTRAGS